MQTFVRNEGGAPNPDAGVPVLYCANHPNRETVLRCNRCDKPICVDCAVLTEVGYRCKECVRGQRSLYFNAGPLDPLIAAAVAAVAGVIVGGAAYALLGIFGFFSFIIAFFVGPIAGGLIAEAVRRSVGRRRAPGLNLVALVATVLGMLLGGVLLLLAPALGAGVPLARLAGSLPRLLAALVRLDVILFAVLAASTIYARLQ